jgi:hypothetical protein
MLVDNSSKEQVLIIFHGILAKFASECDLKISVFPIA